MNERESYFALDERGIGIIEKSTLPIIKRRMVGLKMLNKI